MSYFHSFHSLELWDQAPHHVLWRVFSPDVALGQGWGICGPTDVVGLQLPSAPASLANGHGLWEQYLEVHVFFSPALRIPEYKNLSKAFWFRPKAHLVQNLVVTVANQISLQGFPSDTSCPSISTLNCQHYLPGSVLALSKNSL